MTRSVCVTAVLFLLAAARFATGATINLTFDSGGSDTPGYDQDGARLMVIMQEAARRWEDIIEDSHTMDVLVRYENIANSSTLATAGTLEYNGAGNRTTKGIIRFDTPRDWYFDPSPTTDSEFRLTQKTLGELSANDQSEFFIGAPILEPLLEIEYDGRTNGSDPNASNAFDALSTAMHELGHLLGITWQLPAGVQEIEDHDFDLPASLLGGRQMAAITATTDDGKPEPHLLYDEALLSVSMDQGVRSLPTALDVLTAASISGWSNIDLTRQDFLTGTYWGTASNWIGAQVPGAADWAYLRHGGDVQLDQNDSVERLLVAGGSNLFTNDHRLIVDGMTIISAGVNEFPFAQIFVETGGELVTTDMVIMHAELDMSGGEVHVSQDLTNVGTISGHGTLHVGDRLDNGGLISAADGGLLTITSDPGAFIQMSGSNNMGEVRAIAGDVVFQTQVQPLFRGRMEIGPGRFIEVNNLWALHEFATLDLEGGQSSEAVLRGSQLNISGEVLADGRSAIKAPVALNDDGRIYLEDADTRLELGSTLEHTIEYRGGVINGAGTLVQNGHAAVLAGETQEISVHNLDWDGETVSSTTLNAGSHLILNFDRLNDDMDGRIDLTDGHLQVNSNDPWRMANRVNFSGTLNVLDGSELHAVKASVLDVQSGLAVIDAPLLLDGALLVGDAADLMQRTELTDLATVRVAAGATLRMNGETRYRGALIQGDGLIVQNGPGMVLADQKLELTGHFDWDGDSDNSTFLVNTGHTFSLAAKTLNNGSDFYRGELTLRGGLVDVDVADNRWFMAGEMHLEAGKDGGGAGVLGDQLLVLGPINATGGVAHTFASQVRFLSALGSLNVAPDTTVNFNAPVDMFNGEFRGEGTIAVNDFGHIKGGDVRVGRFVVGEAASVELEEGMLMADEVVAPEDTFGFTGGALAPGVFRGDLVNEGGVLSPGEYLYDTARTVIDGAYKQLGDGVLQLELAGLNFDQLKVTGQASLGGTLDIDLLGAFSPTVGDAFSILTADEVSGQFATLLAPSLAMGLAWQLDYAAQGVMLEVIELLAGDYNDDGLVDAADYAVLRGSLGEEVTLPNDLTPGSVTQEDYAVWRSNYGATAVANAPAAAVAAPEPMSISLVMLAVGLLNTLKRRGK